MRDGNVKINMDCHDIEGNVTGQVLVEIPVESLESVFNQTCRVLIQDSNGKDISGAIDALRDIVNESVLGSTGA